MNIMSIFKNKLSLVAATLSFSTVVTPFIDSNSASAMTLIGDSLINRNRNDTASGVIRILTDPFGATTQQLSTWSFYDNDVIGREITPLILKLEGNQYTIEGIGTTRTSDASGVQSFNFDLVSGSADVGGNLFFGWKDGSNGSNNRGVVDYNNNNSDLMHVIVSGATNFSVGDTYSFQNRRRSYSIQATAVETTTVPEVSPTLGILALGGIFSISCLKKNLIKS